MLQLCCEHFDLRCPPASGSQVQHSVCNQVWLLLVLLGMAMGTTGCRYGTECCVEQRLLQMGCEPLDISAAEERGEESAANDPLVKQSVRLAAAEPTSEPPAPPARFAIPSALPGANAPPVQLPPFAPNQSVTERQSAVEALFRPLPELPARNAAPQPAGQAAVSLTDLQQMAYENSPRLRQAAADVDNARGTAIQAGLYPNPVAGYEQDTARSGDTAGQYGGFVSQEFVTANKLQLARNAGLMAVQSAEFTLRRVRIEVASQVRQGYFDALVAQERVKFTRALAQFSDEVYRAQIELVAGGEAAPYEPLQLRVFALQARNAVRRAENDYLSAWRRLAAQMGVPGLSPVDLAGTVNAPVPQINYEAALNFLLTHHTNLVIAQADIDRAQYNLRLQRVTPIPNVSVQTVFQQDTTTPPNNFTYNLQVGVPLPIFNNNRGNIVSGEAQLAGAHQALTDTRNTLTADLAEVFNRYATNLAIAETYRADIISDQVRTYRGIHDRFRQGAENVDFAQLVVAQQTLGQVITDYLNSLSDQWRAVVDLAQLLQIDDIFQMQALLSPATESLPTPAER